MLNSAYFAIFARKYQTLYGVVNFFQVVVPLIVSKSDKTGDEAKNNLKEALELYCEDHAAPLYLQKITETPIGEIKMNFSEL